MLSSALGQPFSLKCGVTVNNRIAKSALSEGIAEANGRPSEALDNLYKRWGQGGAGILFTGNVMVDKDHLVNANVMIADAAFEADYKRLADNAQAEGAQLWMQINHPGRQSPVYLDKAPVSASNVKMPSKIYLEPRSLEGDEIVDLIVRYGDAALLAKKSGMKGAQIHGAHGYLVSQFLSPLTNLRTDKWGGSLENRARFVLEIYRNMRSKVGANFPISIKINSADFQRGAFTEEESMEVIRLLDQEGMDLIEVSGGTYERAAMVGTMQKESTKQREAYFMDFIVKVRKQINTPLMLTGGFRTISTMDAAIEGGELDFVGLGRPFCVFPEVAKELISGNRTDCTVPDLLTGVDKIDMTGMLQTPWNQFQLIRMGKGLEPDINMDVWEVFEKVTGKPRPV
ncbi:MAG: 2,4-dienoyl-CoA reductase-like NADH-dependent reductase (Old Yellow Enzyme family) [Saprospiraceae bacterium]|jgi:2,4-dienoyl-CoA reductase-like NADH-dependent reductase (Old Yellow Enzyme family)